MRLEDWNKKVISWYWDECTWKFEIRKLIAKRQSHIATTLQASLIARFMGPKWGPYGADRTQVGPMLAPWTLLSGMPFNLFLQHHLPWWRSPVFDGDYSGFWLPYLNTTYADLHQINGFRIMVKCWICLCQAITIPITYTSNPPCTETYL